MRGQSLAQSYRSCPHFYLCQSLKFYKILVDILKHIYQWQTIDFIIGSDFILYALVHLKK